MHLDLLGKQLLDWFLSSRLTQTFSTDDKIAFVSQTAEVSAESYQLPVLGCRKSRVDVKSTVLFGNTRRQSFVLIYASNEVACKLMMTNYPGYIVGDNNKQQPSAAVNLAI
jgi:hypothetical protein